MEIKCGPRYTPKRVAADDAKTILSVSAFQILATANVPKSAEYEKNE